MLSAQLMDQEFDNWTLSGRIDTDEELMQVAKVLDKEVFDYGDEEGKAIYLVGHKPLPFDPTSFNVRMSAQVRVGCYISLDKLPAHRLLAGFPDVACPPDGEAGSPAPGADGAVEGAGI